jgi:leucyl aminopeptidase
MPLCFAPADAQALPLTLLEKEALGAWLEGPGAAHRAWVEAAGFRAGLGEVLPLPGEGGLAGALGGYGDAAARARERFPLAAVAQALPPGDWHIAEGLPEDAAEREALGWLLSGYAFSRYRKASERPERRLVAPSGVDPDRVEMLAEAEALTRDLVNTPAADLGPGALEAAAAALAVRFGASIEVTRGEDLLTENLPLVHAVGRAAAEAPRLIDIRHGDVGPRLTLVGKGVCFDTGGLDLKPAQAMGLMKKDMGGAANVLGLAQIIMAEDWPVRLRVLIPAVENAVSAGAFRPGDILASRKGLTVEVNNTDAEGRLVLADALALACEEGPEMLVSMATLTGAARVAVGPDIAPFFTDDGALAQALSESGARWADPVWRLPFHAPYEAMIEPGIADLDNAPQGGFAGAITAALFLRRFAQGAGAYAHFDIYSWQPQAAPGRSKGGLMQGARALRGALPGALGL